MGFYTIILDFAGGTYLAQVEGESEIDACVKWAEGLNPKNIKCFKAKDKKTLLSQILDEDNHTDISGLMNIWLFIATLGGETASIHVVKTSQSDFL